MTNEKALEIKREILEKIKQCKEDYDNSYSHNSMYRLHFYRGKLAMWIEIFKNIEKGE